MTPYTTEKTAIAFSSFSYDCVLAVYSKSFYDLDITVNTDFAMHYGTSQQEVWIPYDFEFIYTMGKEKGMHTCTLKKHTEVTTGSPFKNIQPLYLQKNVHSCTAPTQGIP